MGGPYLKTVVDDIIFKQRVWYTQSKPYANSLYFSTESGYGNAVFHGSYYLPLAFNTGFVEQIYRSTQNRFYAQLGDQSTWATNLLEAKKSTAMIAQRATQLFNGIRAIKRGDFLKAAKIFGVVTPKRVSRKKQFANNFLEFHFGWTPLVKDIGNAVETLQNPLPKRRFRSTAGGSYVFNDRYPPPLGQYDGMARDCSLSYRAGCTVYMSNPDLYLANQLGFTNPAAIAWEAVPFSFVVDWFVPIGQFLNAMTATLGLDLRYPYTTARYYEYRKHGSNVPPFAVYTRSGTGVRIFRYASAISPYPPLSPTLAFSPTRALTAVSLVIQQLKK